MPDASLQTPVSKAWGDVSSRPIASPNVGLVHQDIIRSCSGLTVKFIAHQSGETAGSSRCARFNTLTGPREKRGMHQQITDSHAKNAA